MDGEIKNAVQAMHDEYYDYNVFYIESAGFITESNFSDFHADNLHPQESAFANIAAEAVPLIEDAVAQVTANVANEAAVNAMFQQGFYLSALDTYKSWLENLSEADNVAAYNRLAGAIEKLESGYTYYDDFYVFGEYSSPMDDALTSDGESGALLADAYFYAATNTTNYHYMFGGLKALNDATIPGSEPTAAQNITELFVPSVHFGKYTSQQHGANLADTSAGNIAYSVLLRDSTDENHQINKLVLNTSKLNFCGGLDKFEVTIIPDGYPVIFYNYQDADNWSAIVVSNNYNSNTGYQHGTGFSIVNCVAGVLDSQGNNIYDYNDDNAFAYGAANLWDFTDITDSELASQLTTVVGACSGAQYYYFDSDPMTCTFQWNETDNCYMLTIVDDNTGIKLIDNQSLTSSIESSKMPNLILSDVRNDNSSNQGYLDSTIGIMAVSATFDSDSADELEIDCLPQILGSKILKVNIATAQRLRIDVDFTNLNKAIEAGLDIEEYGVIVAPLDSKVYDSTTGVKVAELKALYKEANYKVSSTAQNDVVVSKRIMNISIKINAADYGKRIALIAYVRINGVNYYSANENESVGVQDGIISTGVMRVMKNILNDQSVYGYGTIIATTAEAYYGENNAFFVTGYTEPSDVTDLVIRYAAGDIGTADSEYAAAKEAAMYIFHYCKYKYVTPTA